MRYGSERGEERLKRTRQKTQCVRSITNQRREEERLAVIEGRITERCERRKRGIGRRRNKGKRELFFGKKRRREEETWQ